LHGVREVGNVRPFHVVGAVVEVGEFVRRGPVIPAALDAPKSWAMKRRILTTSAVVLVAAVVLVILVVVRLDACWGFGAGGDSGTSVAKTALPEEGTAEYWTKERLESATNSPMPSC